MGRSTTTYQPVNVAAPATDTAVWTPGAGKAIYLYGFTLTLTDAGVLKLTEGNDAASTRIVNLDVGAKGGIDRDFYEAPIKLAVDTPLKATITGSGNLIGTLFGEEV